MSSPLFAQIDNTFWFVAPEVSSNHGDRPIFIRVSTMEYPANVTLRMPANLLFTPISRNIPANSTFSFALTSFIDSIENRPANQVLHKGMLLTSDQLVTAYYEEANTDNPEIFPFKGKNALGTEFYISGQTDYANQTNDGSEAFDIIATEDSTLVTITPTLDIVGHLAGVPFQIKLNKGQTYSARTLITTATKSLAGSHIVASKPIAITISDDSIITGGWDLIGDQTIPINLLGNKYIVIKGFADNSPPANDDERAYVLATKDNTSIYLDGNATPVTTLNTGQQYDYPIPADANTAYFTSSNPVYVYHLSGNPGEAGSSIIPQDSCTGSKQIGFNRTASGFFAMLILTRNGNQDSFYLNGNKGIINGASFTVVPGTSNQWVYYRNSMTTAQVPLGANLLKNTLGKFHLGIINDVGASSEYGYYSDFSSLYLGADRTLCPGDSVILDAGPYMNSYQWKKDSAGNWITVDTARFITIHDTGYYACMTNGDFCTLQDTIHIGFYPNATVSLGPDQDICEGSSIILDAGSFNSYLWSTGSTARKLTVSSGGSYWVRATNNNGCIAYDTINITVDSIPKTPSPISGAVTVCQGQTGMIYSVNPVAFAASYAWTLPPGVTGASASNSITLDYSVAATSGTLKVKGENSCGDGPEVSLGITVNPLVGTAGAITGMTEVCQGQSGVIYSISPVDNASGYIWTVPPGVMITSGAGTPAVTVDFSLGASSGNVEVYANNTCGNSNTASFPVTVDLFPVPAGPISGSSTICQGQNNIAYSIPSITGADSYSWTLPAGVAILSGAGTRSITVYFDSTLSVSGNFSVFGHSNKCGDGLPSTLSITVNPLPAKAGPITGLNPVCQGQSGIPYSIPAVNNATNYIWTLPAGATIASGAGTNNITVNFSTSAVSGPVSVRGNNALCGDGVSSSIPLVVDLFPQPAGVITGDATICQGQSGLVYSVPAITGADSYIWTYPSGVSILSGSGTNNITVSFDSLSSVSGSFTARGHSNKCGDGIASGFAVTVNPLPVPAGVITGPATICQGVSAVYSVPPILNATGYIWSLPAGITVTSGSGTHTITVMFTPTAVSGPITVKGTNALCGDGLSSSLNVNVNPLPVAAGVISGTSPVCQTQSNVPYSLNPVTFATSYIWTYSGTGATIVNNGNSVLIGFSASASSGDLTATGHNGCGDGPVSPLYSIHVNPIALVSLSICNTLTSRDAQPFTLRGGIPLGGSFSGTGVAGNKFFPGLLPPGIDTSVITYSYTNMSGCVSQSKQTLSVLPAPVFLCGNNFKDIRDNKSYPTLKIGTQCWMAVNLNFGNEIPSSLMAADNCIPEKFCYNDNPASCTSNGGLYSWDELMQYETAQGLQGLCPPGWHVPRESEWNILFAQFINNGFAGSPLKYTGYSGFNALLKGVRALNRSWAMDGFAGLFWSSTDHSVTKAWSHGMNSFDPSVSSYPGYKANAFSVRCLKD